jgi:RNA-binding protein Musashi
LFLSDRSESCKIFVGGLAQEVTDTDFGDYFRKFGPVKDAIVMVDRNTGSSRGFGFITFEKEDAVERVMRQDHELKGKYVEIKRAEPRDTRLVYNYYSQSIMQLSFFRYP